MYQSSVIVVSYSQLAFCDINQLWQCTLSGIWRKKIHLKKCFFINNEMLFPKSHSISNNGSSNINKPQYGNKIPIHSNRISIHINKLESYRIGMTATTIAMEDCYRGLLYNATETLLSLKTGFSCNSPQLGKQVSPLWQQDFHYSHKNSISL